MGVPGTRAQTKKYTPVVGVEAGRLPTGARSRRGLVPPPIGITSAVAVVAAGRSGGALPTRWGLVWVAAGCCLWRALWGQSNNAAGRGGFARPPNGWG